MFKLVCITLMFSFPLVVLAECSEELVPKVANNLGYSNKDNHENYDLSACKVWPDDPSKSVVALAIFQVGSGFIAGQSDEQSRSERMGLYDLYVLVVETGSGKILNRAFQKGALSSDSVSLDNIFIDTGRYFLAPKVRAFGIRIRYGHHNRYAPHEYETLSLYVSHEGKLAPIARFETVNCGGEVGDDDSGHFTDTRRTIVVADTQSHGYSDLLVRETTIESKTAHECMHSIPSASVANQHTLRFNGKRYEVTKCSGAHCASSEFVLHNTPPP